MNIGIDGSGTHSGRSNAMDTQLATRETHVEPLRLEVNHEAAILLQSFYSDLTRNSSLGARAIRAARRVLESLSFRG